jgi:hypothetical protein
MADLSIFFPDVEQQQPRLPVIVKRQVIRSVRGQAVDSVLSRDLSKASS